MNRVVIFTGSYPFSKALEDTFIKPELEILERYFNITIIPLNTEGDLDKEFYKFKNIEVIKLPKITLFKKFLFLIMAIFSKVFYQEISINFKKIKNFKNLVFLLKHIGYSLFIKNFAACLLKEKKDIKIFYTYWFTSATSGLILLKRELKNQIRVISRAHRYDLYEERHKHSYIPLRSLDMHNIDYVITVSNDGANYLKVKYPDSNKKVIVSYLGIHDRKIENPLNEGDIFKLVSCSLVVPVKRVDLIVESLAIFSLKNKIFVEWTHIGGGILLGDIVSKYNNIKNEYFSAKFLGYKNNEEVYNLYKSLPFDYFITLSASEGLPVSIMEAISCGLPIIATSVGGIPEIVRHNYNGFLLSSEPSLMEIVEILLEAYKLKAQKNEEYLKMRKNAKSMYKDKFDYEKNHIKLVNILEELIK